MKTNLKYNPGPWDDGPNPPVKENIMSYEQSEIKCDWCSKVIENGTDVACKSCYEEQEGAAYELKHEVARLEDIIYRMEEKEIADETSNKPTR
ncbi:MAG: hypothetical protein ABIG61_12225 [Planctomycetota bacterium]